MHHSIYMCINKYIYICIYIYVCMCVCVYVYVCVCGCSAFALKKSNKSMFLLMFLFPFFPLERYMYWVNIGTPEAKIEKAGLDGSGRRAIVRPGSSNFGAALSLTLDFSQNRLYWCDYELHVIASSDLGGNNRRIVVRNEKSGFGVAVFGDFVYWVDYDDGALLKANKNGLGNKATLISNHAHLRGVRVYHASQQPNATNRCGTNNGHCSHLCLPSPTGYSCHCADNVPVLDKSKCDRPNPGNYNGGTQS